MDSRTCRCVLGVYLVASLAVARVKSGRLVQICLACRRVQTYLAALAQVSHLYSSGLQDLSLVSSSSSSSHLFDSVMDLLILILYTKFARPSLRFQSSSFFHSALRHARSFFSFFCVSSKFRATPAGVKKCVTRTNFFDIRYHVRLGRFTNSFMKFFIQLIWWHRYRKCASYLFDLQKRNLKKTPNHNNKFVDSLTCGTEIIINYHQLLPWE